MQMSMYGAEFVKTAPTLLAMDGDDPSTLQFKVRTWIDLVHMHMLCSHVLSLNNT